MKRFFLGLTALILCVPSAYLLLWSTPVLAAASMYLTGGGTTFRVGDTVTIVVSVNTGGVAANAFEGTITYPTNLLTGIRGTYAGSVCSLYISQPDPSGGSATFSCGTPSGYTGTGTVASVIFTAAGQGSGTIGLSGCTVLANDGSGTNITGPCTGTSIGVTAAPTPPPTAPPILTPTPTPRPASTPGKTPVPSTAAKPVESAKAPAPTPTPANPAEVTLPPETPTPVMTASPGTTPSPGSTSATTSTKKSFLQSIKDVFGSLKDVPKLFGQAAGVFAVLLILIPVLALILAIVYLIYRLYILERRRRRILDRLFEMELSELASLEGKLDLLSDKGAKGREQYKEEFEEAKERILRQLKPDYNQPIDAVKKKEDSGEGKTEEKST